MIRRLSNTSNSMVRSFLKGGRGDPGIRKGENVHPVPDLEQDRISALVDLPSAVSGVDEEFARQVNAFIEQYRDALEELAR